MNCIAKLLHMEEGDETVTKSLKKLKSKVLIVQLDGMKSFAAL